MRALDAKPWYRRWPSQARLLFIAFTMRLSPARRVLYAIARRRRAARVSSRCSAASRRCRSCSFRSRSHCRCRSGWTARSGCSSGFAALNLLILMEVADRLSLKSDLEIARDIQLAMLPGACADRRRRAHLRRDAAGQHRRRRLLRHPARCQTAGWSSRSATSPAKAARPRCSWRCSSRCCARSSTRTSMRRGSSNAAERAGPAPQPAVAIHHAVLRRLRPAHGRAAVRERRPPAAAHPPRRRDSSNESARRRRAASRSACSRRRRIRRRSVDDRARRSARALQRRHHRSRERRGPAVRRNRPRDGAHRAGRTTIRSTSAARFSPPSRRTPVRSGSPTT